MVSDWVEPRWLCYLYHHVCLSNWHHIRVATVSACLLQYDHFSRKPASRMFKITCVHISSVAHSISKTQTGPDAAVAGCNTRSTPATHDPLVIASFLIVHTNTVPKLMCGVCWPVRSMLCRRDLTGGCFGSLAWRRSFASAPWTTASDLPWLQGKPAQDRKLVAGQSWECSAGGWRWYCTSERHSQPSLKHLVSGAIADSIVSGLLSDSECTPAQRRLQLVLRSICRQHEWTCEPEV